MYYKLKDISVEWINSLPKTIDNNGCWISYLAPNSGGYGHVAIQIEELRFILSRLSYCTFHNLNYYDDTFVVRHGQNCNPACFNYEHLTHGTHSDNMKDRVAHGTHHNAAKECCPKCGGEYHFVRVRTRLNRRTFRRCVTCSNKNKGL